MAIQTATERYPQAELAWRVERLRRRLESMGLIDEDLRRPSGEVDDYAGVAERLLRALNTVGIGRSSPAVRRGARFVRYLDEVWDALEDSPAPASEIRELAGVLDWDMLSRLSGTSVQSLRRYAAGERTAPDEIAQRAHWLTGVVADLRSAYNDAGVRRWFERPRPSFAGRRPSDMLIGDWSPDDPTVAQVRDFAARFTAPTPAT